MFIDFRERGSGGGERNIDHQLPPVLTPAGDRTPQPTFWCSG